MKFCSKCGNELLGDAVICPKCGCSTQGTQSKHSVEKQKKFCSKCGNELLEEAVICPKCGCSTQGTQNKNSDEKQKKFCSKCGNELLEEAVVCPKCGCSTKQASQKTAVAKREPLGKKQINLIAFSIVGLIAAVTVGLLLWKFIRIGMVKEQLAGETFRYYDELIDYYYHYNELSFDDDANCTKYSYYHFFDEDVPSEYDYELEYKIKFKDGMVFLDTSTRTYEIQYDIYGNIEGLYDITWDELYE